MCVVVKRWKWKRMSKEHAAWTTMWLLPECDALFSSTETVWLCTRSISVGGACLFTLIVSVYACHRIAPIFLSTGWYSTNLTMLLLTALQMALLVFECFVLNNPKILVATKYCRALQVAVSCLLYGKLACDMMSRSQLYYQLLAPVVSVTMVLMTADSVSVVLLENDIDCHHASWLVSSMAAVILSGRLLSSLQYLDDCSKKLVLTASFAIPGRIVLEEIKTASRMQQKYLAVVSSAVAELEQSHLQLWTLLVCNVVSTTFQLSIDVYVTYGVSGPNSCNSMFFKDGSGALEQFFRFVVSVVSYLLPNWATIYVFYLLPRFQFSTNLDVDIGRDDSYELLLAGEEPDETPYGASVEV